MSSPSIEMTQVAVHLRSFETKKESIQANMEKLLDEKTSQIAYSTISQWLDGFKHQSYSVSALKITTFPAYLALLGIGTLTFYASINQLMNADYTAALASDVDTRVNFANNITNAAAIFACLTDLPAISYLLYLRIVKPFYIRAMHTALDESYQAGIKDLILAPEMHEELYREHVSKLQDLGVENFYLHPDLQTATGKAYEELAPLLKEIDEELDQGLSMSELGTQCVEAFRQDSCTMKLAKIAAGSALLAAAGLSSFLILENMILVKDSPVVDLFSGDSRAQNTEAFYLTQLGGFFSSITALGVPGYITFKAWVGASYHKMYIDKIRACFERYSPSILSETVMNAFYSIRNFKLKTIGL